MDDFPEDQETNEDGKPVVRHVVRDLSAAVKMKKLQAQADERSRRAEAKASADARKMEAQAELAKIKFEERRRKQELKAEITKMRIGISAVEKARTNIAITTPFLLALLIGGFVLALSFGGIPDEATATATSLLTLLVTGLLANLRSVVSNEGNVDDVANGNGNGKDDAKKKKPEPKPEPKSKKNPLT